MTQTNRILILLPCIIFAAIISLLAYNHTQTYISVKNGDLSVQIGLNPSHIIAPQEIQVSWQVEGVQGIYFNEGGVIGHDQRIVNIDYCEEISFEIISKDSQTLQFNLNPVIWTQPIYILLASILLLQLRIPILQIVGRQIIEACNIRQADYWKHSGIFWFRAILTSIILWISSTYFLPNCLYVVSPVVESSLANPLQLTAITSLIFLLWSILNLRTLFKALQLWKQFIPYPSTIIAVFVYWGFIFDSTIPLLDTFRFPLRLLIFALGVGILFTCQNTNDRVVTIHIPDSKSSRWVFLSSIVVLWIVIYRTQWVSIVDIPFLQTVLGFALFIAPGYLLAKILSSDSVKWTRLITLGFALSIFIVSVLTVISIVLGLSASVFQWIFTVVGVLMLLYTLQQRRTIIIPFSKVTSFTLYETLVMACSLIFVLLLVIITPSFNERSVDYSTYNAIITQFSETTQFALKDPYLGTQSWMKPRLWLIAWPISQSLIVTFANLNILQIVHHINIVLGLLALLAIYDLLHRFEVSDQGVLVAIIVTVFSILTHTNNGSEVGYGFLFRLSQDKFTAAWVLTPIIVYSVYDFLKYSKWRYGLILLVATLAAVNTHATIFFYIALISGICTLLYVLFQSHKWQHIIIIAMIMGVCAIIPFILRELSTTHVFEVANSLSRWEGNIIKLDRLALSDDDVLLGINPQLRDGFGFIVVYIATGIALLRVRNYQVGYYVIACFVTLLFVSNPITAPLVGKVITISQLWRATWLMPFGIAGVVIFQTLSHYTDRISPYLSRLILMIFVLLTMLMVINKANSKEWRISQEKYEGLIEVANFMRSDTDQSQIILFADDTIAAHIPSLGVNIYPIAWRKASQAGISEDEHIERQIDQSRLHADGLTVPEVHNLIDKYSIQYIVILDADVRRLKRILETSPRFVQHDTFKKIDVWKVTSP